MLLSSAPTQIVEAWAAGGDKNVVPVPDPGSSGAASWTLGFPPDTAIDPTSGGVPPSRLDMNGGLFEMSAVDMWMSAGGGFPYNSGFSTAVGGYPKGARVLRATGNGYWLSTADNNTTNPDTGGAGWIPDKAVSSVYAATTQTVNSGTNKVIFDTVEFDSLSQWNAANHRFVANWPGVYRISGAVQLPAAPAQDIATLIYKNGALNKICNEFPQTSDVDLTIPFSCIISMALGDYAELFLSLASNTAVGFGDGAFFQFEYLGAG